MNADANCHATASGMLIAILAWFILSTGIGFIAMFYGPGAVTLIAGLWLGLCGSIIHFLSIVLKRKLHWSYAGLVIGAVTLLSGLIFSGGGAIDPVVAFFVFIAFSIVGYMIFPIADYLLNQSIKRETCNDLHT